MSLTCRSRLALLVSLGATPTTGAAGLATSAEETSDRPAGAPGRDLSPRAVLSWAPSRAGETPTAVPSLLRPGELPPAQAESSRTDSADKAIILRPARADRTRRMRPQGRTRPRDFRWLSAICMTDLHGTSAGRAVCPLEGPTI